MAKIYRIIKILFFILCGLLCGAFYALCISYAGIRVSWLWIWPIGALFCFVRAFMLYKKIRLPRWIRIAYRVCLALALGLFLFLEAKIVSAMTTAPEPDLDYIITLGAAVRNGVPTSPLQLRIDATIEYMQENPDTVLIASGGRGTDEAISEARCIADRVTEAGISPDRIILEEGSTSTEENIRNSFALIPEGARVGVLTSGFHLYRALRITQMQGYEAYGVPAVTYLPLGIHYLVREFFGVVRLEAGQLLR